MWWEGSFIVTEVVFVYLFVSSTRGEVLWGKYTNNKWPFFAHLVLPDMVSVLSDLCLRRQRYRNHCSDSTSKQNVISDRVNMRMKVKRADLQLNTVSELGILQNHEVSFLTEVKISVCKSPKESVSEFSDKSLLALSSSLWLTCLSPSFIKHQTPLWTITSASMTVYLCWGFPSYVYHFRTVPPTLTSPALQK
jgi:hypothetical protein